MSSGYHHTLPPSLDYSLRSFYEMWICLKSCGCHCPGHLPIYFTLPGSVFFFLSPPSPTQVLSLIVDFSGAIIELFFGRKAWRCYPGKTVNIDQHPLHGGCLKLSVCISISSVPLPFLNFLAASLSRSQWGRYFFKNCNSLLISSD